MAEFAQQRLERLLPIFEELQRVQLFTNEEVKRIINQCKRYEYKIEKRTKKKQDFVKYAQYLIHFLALIRERRNAMKYFYKKKDIDFAVGAKIESLFKTACFRCQDDIKLWLSRIEFAKTQKLSISVSQIFMRMIQVHTDKPHLWIAAAKWEFEENGSAESARGILQRALRFNPDCAKLYLELFRLELLYVDKVNGRLDALKTGTETGDNQTGNDETSDAVLDAMLARIVFENAAKKFEGDVDVCVRFAKIAEQFQFAQHIVDYIYEYIDAHYENREERWVALAGRLYAKDTSNWKPCQDIFENAVLKLNTAKMWRGYLQFMLDMLNEGSNFDAYIAKSTLDIFDRASKFCMDALDEDLYRRWIILCENQDIQGDVATAAVDQYPKAASLWEYLLKWKIARAFPEKEIVETFNRAVRVLAEKDTLPIWKLAMSWATQICPDRLEELFEASLLFDATISGPMKISHLNWSSLMKGVVACRTLFRRLGQHKPNSLEFYLEYFELEKAQVSMDVESVRYCFEQAIFEHGTDSVELWLTYVDFEMKSPKGDPGKVTMIYERALKELSDEKLEGFMRSYMELKQG